MYTLQANRIPGCPRGGPYPALVATVDPCGNYTMDRGLSVQGQLIDAVGIVSPLIGDIKMSVRETDYEGWLLCDGRGLLAQDYPDLFSLIGYTFGNDGEGTFLLPDARGRVLGSVQQGSTGTSYWCAGATPGEETHTMTELELVQHTHTSNAIGGQGNLGLCIADGTNTATATDPSSGELNVWTVPQALTIDPTGTTAPFNVMQPTLFLGNTFIYGGVKDERKPNVCTVMPQNIQPCND